MGLVSRWSLAVVLAVAVLGVCVQSAWAGGERRYVVVLEGAAAERPVRVAERHADVQGARVERVLSRSLSGYAARLSAKEAAAIRRLDGVRAVGLDPVGEPAAQVSPLEVRRVFAADQDCDPSDNPAVNQGIDIDCIDDVRVDVDVAVLDTPIRPDHPDLNVVSNVDCFAGDPTPGDDDPSDHTGCDPGPGQPGYDCNGAEAHGEMVAERIAAIDNGIGGVGVAPGARIWSVGVADKIPGGPGHPCGPFYLSDVIAGVEWVTDHADDIEVANMSLTFLQPTDPAGLALDAALKDAIDASIDAGVVYVTGAGNLAQPIGMIPAKYTRPITATAIFDSDGLPGGAGPNGISCQGIANDQDDTNADVTSYADAANPNVLAAPGADIAAPGSCTSFAAAHTAGAVAILASQDNPNNATDVQAIRHTLLTTANPNNKANGGWDDNTGTTREPLLDVSDENTYNPNTVVGDGTDDIIGLDAISLTYDTIDIYARGGDNTLRHRRLVEGAWSDWTRLGGSIASDPGVMSNYDGDLVDVYALGTNGELARRWFHPALGWMPWGYMGGSFTSAPAPVGRFQGYSIVNVFITSGNDNTLWHRWYAPTPGWSDWGSIGATSSSGPAVISRGFGHFNLVTRGLDGDVKHTFYTEAGGWASWGSIGAPSPGSAGDPALATSSPGELNVIVRGSDDALWHKAWLPEPTNAWTGWESLGGEWASNPAATSSASGKLDVFAVDAEGVLWRKYRTASQWSTWEKAR